MPGGPMTSEPAWGTPILRCPPRRLFFSWRRARGAGSEADAMDETGSTRAQQIARAAVAFERERTGHPPRWVAVALAGDTVVVTLHGALPPAEQALAQTPAGAALLREFHREVFAGACGPLREEVGRVAGAEVREASADLEGAADTMVLIFLLRGAVPAETWGGAPPGD